MRIIVTEEFTFDVPTDIEEEVSKYYLSGCYGLEVRDRFLLPVGSQIVDHFTANVEIIEEDE